MNDTDSPYRFSRLPARAPLGRGQEDGLFDIMLFFPFPEVETAGYRDVVPSEVVQEQPLKF